jgi:hypothetical protein
MTVEDVVDKVKDVLTRMKELDVIVNETSEKLWERVEIPALDFSGIRAETKVRKTMKLPVVRARRVEINEKRIENPASREKHHIRSNIQKRKEFTVVHLRAEKQFDEIPDRDDPFHQRKLRDADGSSRTAGKRSRASQKRD